MGKVLAGGEGKTGAFLTDLAVQGNAAAAAQNQAMNALVLGASLQGAVFCDGSWVHGGIGAERGDGVKCFERNGEMADSQ